MKLELLGSGTIEVDDKKYNICRASTEMNAKKEMYDIDQNIKNHKLKHYRNRAIILISGSVMVLFVLIMLLLEVGS